MHLYFFDGAAIANRTGFIAVPGPVEKLGAVGGTENADPEYAFDPFSGSILPQPGGGYRAYVTAFRRGRKEGTRPCIFNSPDGYQWHRNQMVEITGLPGDFSGWMKQPSVVDLGDGSLRMYLWVHGQRAGNTICRLCTAATRDGVRFVIENFDKPVLHHPSELGPSGWLAGWLPAAEQLAPQWKSHDPDFLARLKRMRANDSTYIYREPETGHFVIYGVTLLPNPSGSPRRDERDNCFNIFRVIARWTSTDGYEFSAPEIILAPDSADPLDQQFYYLSVHRQEGWYIGFLGDFEVVDQTQDMNVVFSRDGRAWQRPTRSPFIPRVEGEPDGMNVYAINSLMDAGEDWLLLYRGGWRAHNDPVQPSDVSSNMRLCRFGKRRFVGLDTASNRDARLLTRPFILANSQITLDACVRGRLRAELCDPFGVPLPGYRREDFIPVSGDSRAHVLQWKNKDVRAYQSDAASLRLEATDSKIYALGI